MKVIYKNFLLDIDLFKNYEDVIDKFHDKYPDTRNMVMNPTDILFSASYAEKTIWTSSIFEDSVNLYDINFAVNFEKSFEINVFNEALNEVVRRNDMLRSSYHFIEGELYRKIKTNVKLNITYEQYENVNQDTEEILREVVDADDQMLDLSIPPLFKVKVINTVTKGVIIYFSFHHIIFDGPSVEIFVDQLVEIYSGLLNHTVELSAEDINVEKYRPIVNRENYLDDEYFEESDFFWKNQLMNVDKTLPLLTEESGYTNDFWTSQMEALVSNELSSNVRAFCKENAISPFMLFISTYSVLLSKYTNKDEILIGIPVTTRDQREIRKQIGCFINTVVLKVELWGNPSFREVLYRVKNSVLSIMEHHDYPIMRLYETLKIERTTDKKPLFQVALSYQSSPFKEYAVSGDLKVSVLDVPSKNSMYDIYLEIVSYIDHYVVKMQYNKKAFNKKFVSRMSAHYLSLVQLCLDDIDVNISDCDITSEEEKRQIIEDFNPKQTELLYENFYSMFVKQYKKTPGNIAICYYDQKISYEQLMEMIDNIADILWSNGVRKGSTVGLLLTRSPKLIAALFATRKIGATYVPMEASLPPKRMQYYLENSNANIIITDKDLDYNLMQDRKVIDLRDSYLTGIYGYLKECNQDKDVVAYICYTSGTTGNPKGIVVTEENVYAFYRGIVDALDVDHYSNWLFESSLSFDPHVLEVFVPLLLGKTVSIVPDDYVFDIPKIRSIIAGGVEFIHITPTKAELVFGEADGELLKKVKAIAFGAEPLTKKLLKIMQDIYHGEIINIYGPTEACVYSTVCRRISLEKSISVGKPILGYNVLILNDNDELVPIGIPGQICISGRSVAQEYYKLPQITNEVFTTNPFDYTMRMYRTGDVGKWDEDGNIIFIGRNDNQIKIRGNRVELDEIEINIEKLPYVKQAKVVYKDDDSNGMILVAYIKLDFELLRRNYEDDVSVSKIREDIIDYLPSYMVPSYFIKVQEFPMTISGKMDIKNLPEITDNNLDSAYIKPETEFEIMIYRIFSEVLKINRIGILDNFFSLGGESMKAIQAIAKLNDLGYSIEVKEFFKNPTIKNLSHKMVKKEFLVNEVEKTDKQKELLSQIEYLMVDRFTIDIKRAFEEKLFIDCILAVSVRYEQIRTCLVVVDREIKIVKRNKLERKHIKLEYVHHMDEVHTELSNFKFPLFHIAVVLKDDSFTVIFYVHKIISCDLEVENTILADLKNMYMNQGERIWKPEDFKLVHLKQKKLNMLSINVEDIFPLSYKQKMLLAQTVSKAQSGLFVKLNHITFKIHDFERKIFYEALNRVVNENEMLKSVYKGRLHYQVILRCIDISCDYMDLSDELADEIEKKMQAFIDSVLKHGFDFEHDNLLKCALIKLDDNLYDFVTYHHISIMDGSGYEAFVNSVFRYYIELSSGFNIAENEQEYSYKEYVIEESKVVMDECENSYWKDKLEGIKTKFQFQQMKTSQYIEEEYATCIYRDLSSNLVIQLRDSYHYFDKPRSLIYLSAYFILCNLILKESKLVIGVVTDTRIHKGADSNMLGYYSNILPYIMEFQNEAGVKQMIQSLYNQFVEMKSHELYPIYDVCNICFTYINTDYDKCECESDHGIEFIEPVMETYGHTDHDFYLTVKERRNKITISIECGDNLFKKKDLENLINKYSKILEVIITNKDFNFSEIINIT